MRERLQPNPTVVAGGLAATDEFLTDEQLAALIHVDGRTTLRWRNAGGGPPFVRVGPRRILYRRSDVEAWLDARTFPHRAAESVDTRNTAPTSISGDQPPADVPADAKGVAGRITSRVKSGYMESDREAATVT
jgi:predicted DNA-binding transcriptional regulator AlpA